MKAIATDEVGGKYVKLVTVFSAIFAVVFFFVAILSSFFGIDLSDEGFYLNWISDPSVFKYSISQFGFVFHPLYRVLGQSVVAIRIFNICIVYILSALLFFIYFDKVKGRTSQAHVAALSLSFASLGMLCFSPWLLTPSYNSLNFISILITLIGCERLLFNDSKPWFNSIVIGVGGTMCFMAKPSSAVMLSGLIILFVLLLVQHKRKALLTIISASCVSFCLTAFLIDGSVVEFIFGRILGGLSYVEEMGGHSKLFRLDDLSLGRLDIVLFFIIAVVSGFITSFIRTSQMFVFYAICCISGLVAFLLIVFNAFDFRVVSVTSIYVWAPILGIAVAVYRSISLADKRIFFFFIFCIFASFVYAFGTNNNYWQVISSAIVFVVFGFVVATGPSHINWRIVLPLGGLTQFICCIVVADLIRNPYRQSQPLFMQSEVVHLGGSDLFVESFTRRYVLEVRELLEASGFEYGTPVIDLTGHYPGTIFAMRGKAIIHPWILGGYPGSANFFLSGVRDADCVELSKAWLIIEEGGPRGIPQGVLAQLGVDLIQYQNVGEVESLMQDHKRTYKHVFYRPKVSEKVRFKECKR